MTPEFKPSPWQTEFVSKESATEFRGIGGGKTEILIRLPILKGYISGPPKTIIFIGARDWTVDRMLDVYFPYGAEFEEHRRRFIFPNGTKLYCVRREFSLISVNGDLALVDNLQPEDDTWLKSVKARFKHVFACGEKSD